MAPRRLVLLTLCALGTHCSSPPPPAAPAPPEPCERSNPTLTLAASERANAVAGDGGLPVRVRLYQLRSDARLQSASFEEVWQDDKAVLQDDLLKVDELTAYPGQSQQLKVELAPDSTNLTAVALFRDPQGRDWLSSFELEPPRSKPPCPPSPPEIKLWVDRMKIQDGQGLVEAQGPARQKQ